MTREQIRTPIDLHETRLQWVKNILDRYYYDIEDNDEQEYWVHELIKEKKILDGLRNENPDD